MDTQELSQRIEALEAVVIGTLEARRIGLQALAMAVPPHAAPVLREFIADQRRQASAHLPPGADRYFEADMDLLDSTLRQIQGG